ncbi:MAG: [FeFe] hydrogenase H-cluster radical SAM maturase HydE [Heliobacteriaceae bacterium]|nr:[FeFe] hydrogenase H-cluster radical SAM maturase HydE [Heliobacteriaceae bacterium]
MSEMRPEFLAAFERAATGKTLAFEDILALLQATAAERPLLYRLADQVRAQTMGETIYLRGIIEFSNYCSRNCLYCGLRRDNRELVRYRMTGPEIIAAARVAADRGIETIVLQSGEDGGYPAAELARTIKALKAELAVTVTLSAGDRSRADYVLWRQAGADRYLLKHETADARLFSRLRPGTGLAGRLTRLGWLQALGYQTGAGNIVGLPGQTLAMLARDILLLRRLKVTMAGIGPFIAHAATPLAGCPNGDPALTLNVLAVTRLVLPGAYLPATTALASIDPAGREQALQAGANVVMVNMTPPAYREHYFLYPGKAGSTLTPVENLEQILSLIHNLRGRKAGDQDGRANC